MILKPIHFVLGVLGIILFLLTGLYMHIYQGHLLGMADGPRMVYRASHIYILLTAIINLTMGAYITPVRLEQYKILQWLVSLLLILAPVFITAGFFTEPDMTELARPYTRIALQFMLLPAALLVITSEFLIKIKSGT